MREVGGCLKRIGDSLAASSSCSRLKDLGQYGFGALGLGRQIKSELRLRGESDRRVADLWAANSGIGL